MSSEQQQREAKCRAVASQLTASFRNTVEEHGYRVVKVKRSRRPVLIDITVEPPPGEARMQEFVQMAIDRIAG